MSVRSLSTFLSFLSVVLALSPIPNVTLPLSLPPATSPSQTPSSAPVAPTTYPFTPFPTPTQQPVPGVFPATDPSQPPPVRYTKKRPLLLHLSDLFPQVDSFLVPDFAPAWAAAYHKAKDKVQSHHVCEASFLTRFLPRSPSSRSNKKSTSRLA